MVIINRASVRWWEKQFVAVAVQLGPPAGLEDIHTWEYVEEVTTCKHLSRDAAPHRQTHRAHQALGGPYIKVDNHYS